jgi:hypothetical protein
VLYGHEARRVDLGSSAWQGEVAIGSAGWVESRTTGPDREYDGT